MLLISGLGLLFKKGHSFTSGAEREPKAPPKYTHQSSPEERKNTKRQLSNGYEVLTLLSANPSCRGWVEEKIPAPAREVLDIIRKKNHMESVGVLFTD